MRILLVSVVYGPTPPIGYGGIQRVVHVLAEELVRLGHEVILVAPPGSRCSGRVLPVPAYGENRSTMRIRSESDMLSEEPLYEAIQQLVAAERVDVIHDWSFFSLFVRRHPERFPFVISTCVPPAPGFARPNLVACSRAHAELIGGTTRYVHYGLPLEEWEYSPRKTAPMVHIAKIARFKAQHLAVLAARRAGRPLRIAGNVEDRLYYRAVLRPLLWLSPGVDYVGEVEGTHHLLRDAAALVQTPRWFDAFPLVVLEAMASGTPVVSLDQGGISEQVVPGRTGFLCGGLGDLVEAFQRVPEIRPADCRAHAEENFSVNRMARNYLELYERVADGERW